MCYCFVVAVLDQGDPRPSKSSADQQQSKQQTTVEFIAEDEEVRTTTACFILVQVTRDLEVNVLIVTRG